MRMNLQHTFLIVYAVLQIVQGKLDIFHLFFLHIVEMNKDNFVF